MATVMNKHQAHHVTSPRTGLQKMCIAMGLFFILIGLAGIVMPGMFGLHLSLFHNIIHLASGAMALASGYADDPRKAHNFSIGFGVLYGLLALAGFIFGEPGYPGVGHMEADDKLLRVIPNVLEFGTADHFLHIILSAILLVSANLWKKRRDSKIVTTTREQSNSDGKLKDESLGVGDIHHQIDSNRRSDFENRI